MEHTSDKPPEMNATRRRLVVCGALLLLAAAVCGAWLWHRSGLTPPSAARAAPPEDPRLHYAGPFLNVHPDVPYVGDAACAGCHADIARTFAEHPMGRSLLPISSLAGKQRYDAAVHNPFRVSPASKEVFLVERKGGSVLHRQFREGAKDGTLWAIDLPVAYAIGSGAHGHSYLTNRGGFLFQTPISWFSQKKIWDLSPGLADEHRTGRPIPAMCLFCHANRARPREGTINGYEEPIFDGHAIGCERCHGPGGRHLSSVGAHKSAGGADLSIVNPRHLEPKLRAAVCEQCHLAGEVRVLRRGRDLYDYRPGLPLEDFIAIFVRQPGPNGLRKAVNHVEQMYLSQCFLHSVESPAEGKRKLGCTSCHDPHRHIRPADRGQYYRARCLACHDGQGTQGSARSCSVPEVRRRAQHPDDSCVECHMPRYTAADIAHNATTDHRILRRPEDVGTGAGSPSPVESDLVSFYQQRPDSDPRQAQRDLGIALARQLVQQVMQLRKVPGRLGSQTVAWLEAAVDADPDDLAAWQALARTLALLDRTNESLAAYEKLLARDAHSEVALQGAAMVAEQLGQSEAATDYWRRAVAECPEQPAYRASLAELLVRRSVWREAGPQLEAWLRLDPRNVEAHMLWARYLLRFGDQEHARAELATIEELGPPNLEHFRARFEVELRSQRRHHPDR
jgi:Flp pilus assembly protein TadD